VEWAWAAEVVWDWEWVEVVVEAVEVAEVAVDIVEEEIDDNSNPHPITRHEWY
jgi:hypothetical protein